MLACLGWWRFGSGLWRYERLYTGKVLFFTAFDTPKTSMDDEAAYVVLLDRIYVDNLYGFT